MVVGNCEGCGKTLLVKLALGPVFGPVAVTAFPLRDKMSEIINAVARDGRPYLFLDNIKGECSDTALEAFLLRADSAAGHLVKRTRSMLRNVAWFI